MLLSRGWVLRHRQLWRELEAIITSPAADTFGYFVALPTDGNALAVGAYWEGSNAIGINGNPADNSMPNSGAVYLY